MRKWICLPVFFALLFYASHLWGGEAGDAIIGPWLTQDKDAEFEIYKCGQEYCGKISGLEDPFYPLTARADLAGRPRMDRKNPDPRLRSRPLLGLTIFERLRYEGDNTWRGKVYNPEDGRTYSCKLSIAGQGDSLKVRGYLGLVLFGQTQTWTRQVDRPGTSGAGAHSTASPPG